MTNGRLMIGVGLLLAACNNGSPASSLTQLTDVTTSARCPAGGVQISTGPDTNHDGTLGQSEIVQTSEVCNGKTASNGDAGAPGAPGIDALVETTSLPVGDPTCAAGGVKIDVGLDDGAGGGIARNDKLEAGEILSSRTVCGGGTKYSPGSTVPPASPAGAYKITTSGGNGLNDGAGNAGDINVEMPYGSLGGHTKIFKTGQTDAGFSPTAIPALVAGTTPMVVSADLTLKTYPSLADGLTSADPFFLVSDDGLAIYANVAGAATPVTSLSVLAGKTLTTSLNFGTQALLTVRKDIRNAGTIAVARLADGVSAGSLTLDASNYYGESGSSLNLKGTTAAAAPGGSGGTLELDVGARFLNQGTIDTSGGGGSVGGPAGGLSVNVAVGELENWGALAARGGGGLTETGGNGGAIELHSGYRAFRNAGALNSSGGAGPNGGGRAGTIRIGPVNIGLLLNTGSLTAQGGACTQADCNAGQGDEIVLENAGADLRSSGDLNTSGGSSGTVGYGGQGGTVRVTDHDDLGNYAGNISFPSGSIHVSGNLTTSGGDGFRGGTGGLVDLQLRPASLPQGQELVLFGYTDLVGTGGSATGAQGGAGARIRISNDFSKDQGIVGPGAAAINYANVNVRGGDGQTGGQGGWLRLQNQTSYNFHNPNEYVANFAVTVDLSGGNGASGNGGQGGQLHLIGVEHAENHANLTATGGTAAGAGVSSGPGGSVEISSDDGAATNTATLDLSSNDSSDTGNAGGSALLDGTTVTNSGAITCKGGKGTGPGGVGGTIELVSTPLGATTNTGTLSVAGGVGTPAGDKGRIRIDGNDVTP